MTTFQLIALVLTLVWLLLVVLRFRRSSIILIAGLVVIGSFTLVSGLIGLVSAEELGLSLQINWGRTLVYALAGLAVLLAYSPLANRLAVLLFKKPPTLQAFDTLQRSWVNLSIGILVAWMLGGFLEELVARGIVLTAIHGLLTPATGSLLGVVIAILVAALGAGLMHLYQGPRAAVIIAQLSVLFGLLFALSGYNLWAVIVCHGIYDTIAFIRYARGRSKYSKEDKTEANPDN